MDGHIRWVNGPQPASTHDLTFLCGGKKSKEKEWKKSSLYFNLLEGLRLVGDSAYKGQPDKVSTTNAAHDPSTIELFARMKSMQETLFKRLKDFKVLRGPSCHGQGTKDKLEKIKLVLRLALYWSSMILRMGTHFFKYKLIKEIILDRPLLWTLGFSMAGAIVVPSPSHTPHLPCLRLALLLPHVLPKRLFVLVSRVHVPVPCPNAHRMPHNAVRFRTIVKLTAVVASQPEP